MKKIIIINLIVITTMLLSACGIKGKPIVYIESYEWKLQSVMNNNTEIDEDKLVVAVAEQDEFYPNAKVVDIMLIAQNGEITLTDVTNNKIYIGTYKMIEETSKSATYEIVIDDIEGSATITIAERLGNKLTLTLSINLGEYTVYFSPSKTDTK